MRKWLKKALPGHEHKWKEIQLLQEMRRTTLFRSNNLLDMQDKAW